MSRPGRLTNRMGAAQRSRARAPAQSWSYGRGPAFTDPEHTHEGSFDWYRELQEWADASIIWLAWKFSSSKTGQVFGEEFFRGLRDIPCSLVPYPVAACLLIQYQRAKHAEMISVDSLPTQQSVGVHKRPPIWESVDRLHFVYYENGRPPAKKQNSNLYPGRVLHGGALLPALR